MPGSPNAIVASAPGRPFAQKDVPSRGSTATSKSGPPSPRPTTSPLNSMGASSFSPSPMTTVPCPGACARMRRIASVAAPSAASWSCRPTHARQANAAPCVAASATASRAPRSMRGREDRSSGCCMSGSFSTHRRGGPTRVLGGCAGPPQAAPHRTARGSTAWRGTRRPPAGSTPGGAPCGGPGRRDHGGPGDPPVDGFTPDWRGGATVRGPGSRWSATERGRARP